MKKFQAIGLMSGTSLDGLDLLCADFYETGQNWEFSILAAQTMKYTASWRKKLEDAPLLSGEALWQLHVDYGMFLGERVRDFVETHALSPLLVASHGHTVFHRPASGMTAQIGSGASLAAAAHLNTVADFRSLDIALGGQGAPLVPLGDKYLFPGYKACVNLGGFGNLSFKADGQRLAFDICPVNIVLNNLAKFFGKDFDPEGTLASGGQIDGRLLDQLNKIPFYHQRPPKSLGREWLDSAFLPLLSRTDLDKQDQLRTLCEHIAIQVGRSLSGIGSGKVFFTGGGAHNTFLMSRIAENTNLEVIIPEAEIVDFKEALVFAFLGVLRLTGQVNCLRSATGASKDNIGGAHYCW